MSDEQGRPQPEQGQQPDPESPSSQEWQPHFGPQQPYGDPYQRQGEHPYGHPAPPPAGSPAPPLNSSHRGGFAPPEGQHQPGQPSYVHPGHVAPTPGANWQVAQTGPAAGAGYPGGPGSPQGPGGPGTPGYPPPQHPRPPKKGGHGPLYAILGIVGLAIIGGVVAVLALTGFFDRSGDNTAESDTSDAGAPAADPSESPASAEGEDPDDDTTAAAEAPTEEPEEPRVSLEEELSSGQIQDLLIDTVDLPYDPDDTIREADDYLFLQWSEEWPTADEIQEIEDEADEFGYTFEESEQRLIECYRSLTYLVELDETSDILSAGAFGADVSDGLILTLGIVSFDAAPDTGSMWDEIEADCDGASVDGDEFAYFDHAGFRGLYIQSSPGSNTIDAAVATMDMGTNLVWVDAADIGREDFEHVLDAQAEKLEAGL